MKALVNALWLVLLLQLGIVALMFWPEAPTADPGSGPLLNADVVQQLDEIQISDDADNTVALLRSGEQWLLPDLGGLPASAERVSSMLQRLQQAKTGWPVAETPGSHQRFAVAPYQYQRYLRLLEGGEELAGLYLGSSPGYRQVHVRQAASNAVYSIEFNNFDLGADPVQWLDKTLLQIEQPTSLRVGDLALTNSGGNWRNAAGEPLLQNSLQSLLEALSYLQVNGVASEEQTNTLRITTPTLQVTAQSDTGNDTLTLYEIGDFYFVNSAKLKRYFTLSAYDFDRFRNVNIEVAAANTAAPVATGQ